MISGLKCCDATGALSESVQPRADQYFPHTNLILWAAGLRAGSRPWMSLFFAVSLSLAVTRSVFVSLYDTVSVFPSIFLPSLSRSPPRSPLSARSIYQCVSLSHVCCPCQQNGWQTVFISTLRDARTVWQLWELSTGIRQSLPLWEVTTVCLPVWWPRWSCLVGLRCYILCSQIAQTVTFPFTLYSYVSCICFPSFWDDFKSSNSLNVSTYCEDFLLFPTYWWINKSLITTGW